MTRVGSSVDVSMRFARDGFLILSGFFDVGSEIVPIQRGIFSVVAEVASRHGIEIPSALRERNDFDAAYQALIAVDRRFGGEVYDAIKQVPAFLRIASSARLEELFCALRPSAVPGVAAGGFGIRIDNPGDDRFRANWHQEYPAQLRSLDGIVFWTPLVAVDEARGPVRICVASHCDGLRVVERRDRRNSSKTGAYGLTLANESDVVSRYEVVAPPTNPGDLVVLDFKTIHASGTNASAGARWSIQTRFFNFAEPTGRSHGWSGSFAAGVDFARIHPELVSEDGNGA